MIKIPNNAILTGVSALTHLGLIDFNPEYKSVAMPVGSVFSNYTSFGKLRITTLQPETLNYEVTEHNGIKIYSKERLFVELNTFGLNAEFKSLALKNLTEQIDPIKVRKIYKFLKDKRRKLNPTHVEDFINKEIIDIKRIINTYDNLVIGDLVRELAIFQLSELNSPILLKGGSAVEVLTMTKRATQDIDTHIGKTLIEKIIENLKDSRKDVYFKIKTIKDKEITPEILNEAMQSKKIVKLNLFPMSRSEGTKTLLKGYKVEITFNFSYNEDELVETIKNFKLTRHLLRILQRPSCITFSKEMIMAEKFNALITNPEYQTRTKDLFDLNSLSKDGYDFRLLSEWFFKQCKVLRTPLTDEQAIEMIKANKDKELIKVKGDFKNTALMFDVDLEYDQAILIYKELINKFLGI